MFSIFNFQPLDQFEINHVLFYWNFFSFNDSAILKNLLIDYSQLTNSLLYLILVYLLIKSIFGSVFVKPYLVQNNLQYLLRLVYQFVFSLVKQQINVSGYVFFPLVMTLFLFILFANLIGLTLYSFTLTSHVTIAFTLSFSLFCSVIILVLLLHKSKFIYIFVPSDAPKALLPFLIVIEIISYLSRPFSLGIRLFANMMSGHTLLAILSNFVFVIAQKNVLIAIFPIILIIAIVGLETMIAILQAYVFTVLICIYINDSILGPH